MPQSPDVPTTGRSLQRTFAVVTFAAFARRHRSSVSDALRTCRYTSSLRNPGCRSARGGGDGWGGGGGFLREPNRPPRGTLLPRALTSRDDSESNSSSSGSSGNDARTSRAAPAACVRDAPVTSRFSDTQWDIQLAARRTSRHARAATNRRTSRHARANWLTQLETKEREGAWGTAEKRLALAQKARWKEEQAVMKELLKEATVVKKLIKDVRFLLDRQLREARKSKAEEAQRTINRCATPPV